VGIPFCPTRCRYCSYVSHAIGRAGNLLPEYLQLLLEEIRVIGETAKAQGLRPLAVYIGGGTPTVLDAGQLAALMSRISGSFDTSNLLEYTVEAGRADTITAEKLAAIKAMGAGRVSVNPQSMTPHVLEAIGRRHTPEDVERGFWLAREAGFDWINMDLIAGLPGETPESFAASLGRILALSPENITVHALAVKRSSEMRANGEGPGLGPKAAEMQRHAAERLKAAGYAPYYLYRQKPAVDNLENTGYAKPGYEAAYNIYSMDDAHNILAAGAGAVSKLMCADKKIKRVFNHKYPYEYISRFGEIISRKGELS
jgi:oxygen-independent coproporphyrinogen-3 oxidase